MIKIINILVIVLLLFLGLVNSHLLSLFGINLPVSIFVNGNFEFTKVMFFNVISGVIITLFIVERLLNKKEIKIPFAIIPIAMVFLFSTIFSISPYISFFGNDSKAHSLVMFINILGLFIVFLHQKKKYLKKFVDFYIISGFIVSVISIWQYYYPSFDYGDLGNRALGTFGHPNYLALYLLLTIPYLYNKIRKSFSGKNIILGISSIIIILSLILTKSAWGITLFLIYTVYFVVKKYKLNLKTPHIIFGFSIFIFLLILLVYNLYPEKLQSFISRFFIWESTIKAIFSSPKTFLIGNGFETLDLVFEKYKSIYLYIFENIGYTADRPHNLFLYIFYSTGFVGGSLFIYLLHIFVLKIKNFNLLKTYYSETIILFLFFTFLNFSSISSYLILVLFLSIFLQNFDYKKIQQKLLKIWFILFILVISIGGIYSSIAFYKAETNVYNKDYDNAINIFKFNPSYYYNIGDYNNGILYGKYKGEAYFYSKIKSDINYIEKNCSELILFFPTSENYFYCGDLFDYLGKEKLSESYYRLGLSKLPNLWDKNSKHYNNFFIRNFIDGKRFFSNKYSNLEYILEQIK